MTRNLNFSHGIFHLVTQQFSYLNDNGHNPCPQAAVELASQNPKNIHDFIRWLQVLETYLNHAQPVPRYMDKLATMRRAQSCTTGQAPIVWLAD